MQNQTATVQDAGFHISGPALVQGGFFAQGGSGDLDGNGRIDTGDTAAVEQWLSAQRTVTAIEYARGDVNGDGRLTMLDVEAMQALIGGMRLADVQREFHRTADIFESTRFNGGSGDADGNGLVNVGDRTAINAWLAGSVTLTIRQFAAADVTADGRVDRQDIEGITQLINGAEGSTVLGGARRAAVFGWWSTMTGYPVLGMQVMGRPPDAHCNDSWRGALAMDITTHRIYVCNLAPRGWDHVALND